MGAIGRNSGTVKPTPTLCAVIVRNIPSIFTPVRAYRTIFVGDDDDKFRLDFSYKGPVRVKGTVDCDAEGNPAHVSVAEVERLQSELPLLSPNTGDH